ncbi:MAG: ParA family protein [Bacillaceae bacterium]
MNIITIANFKGGVGKTTTSVLFSYLLQEQGKRVLLLDLDPQANATNFIFKTFGVKSSPSMSLFESFKEQDLSKALMTVSPNLDILPSDIDLVGFQMHLYTIVKNSDKRHYFLSFLLEKLQKKIGKEYDYIIIDVPPTISEFTNNAIVASDYVLLVMQTHEDSYGSAVKMIDYMRDLKEFNENIKLLGVIPYLVYQKGNVDHEVINDARNTFGDLVFENQIHSRERIKRFSKDGIKNEDMHDKKVLDMYRKVLNELEERINE